MITKDWRPGLRRIPLSPTTTQQSRKDAQSKTTTAGERPTSDLAQQDPAHLVVGGLLQDQSGAGAGRGDVVAQVGAVDRRPDAQRRLAGLLVGQAGEAVEVGAGVGEGRASQGEEALDVPALEVGLGG